jgi:4-hydroxythreonine-4-phosphate dehydrogenase
MTNRKRIGITMGDPSGVGPEIICKALRDMAPEERSATAVIGDPAFLRRADALLGTGLTFGPAASGDLAPGTVPVAEVITDDRAEVRDGEVTAAGGEAAHTCVVRAVELALGGDIAAIVTTPLNKAALHAAGHEFEGHTELLAHLTGAEASFMLLASEGLATVHVSTHIALKEAVTRATRERVLATIRAGHDHLVRLGNARPRVAVAGLNPHCGEGGLFGHEEIERIGRAIDDCRAEGIDARGPISPDTIFHRAAKGEFDLVVAQYHDQGHIPMKLLAFDTTVNVTLGLPIRRCSVDHGTAFDIAWQGIADHTNVKAATAYARRMAGASVDTAVG